MAAIIEIAIEGTLKTQIIYKANLSFTQLTEYLPSMLDSKLLTQTIYDGREGFVVTEQGVEFLKKHSDLVNMLKNTR
jgi:predicted transcriptional regulator